MKPKINWIRIQKIAYKLREDLGIEEPSDLLLMDVAEYLGIEVEISDLVNYEAYLMRYGNEGIIRLKAGSNPNRQRFSLAHEIGHWLLHPRLTQKFSVASDMVDYHESKEEIEANLFATELLVPKICIPGRIIKGDPNFAFAEQIAKICGVSLMCAVRRLAEISHHPVILVVSSMRDRATLWTCQSDASRRFFIYPGTKLPENSQTAECLNHGIALCDPEDIEGETWFPNEDLDVGFELTEEVRVLGTYEISMTLLWMPGLI